MRQMLEEKLARFEELERQMSDPEVLAESTKLAAVARASFTPEVCLVSFTPEPTVRPVPRRLACRRR